MNVGQDSRSLDLDLNQVPFKYEGVKQIGRDVLYIIIIIIAGITRSNNDK
jgi:hypothetical protein